MAQPETREQPNREMEDRSMNNYQPPSPGSGPVQIRACIEELLRFTLASAVDGTLVGCVIGLSSDYCASLLEDDPHRANDPNSSSTATGFPEGVPEYPLYGQLALALYECASSGSFFRAHHEITLIQDDSSWKQKEDEWLKSIKENGSKLLNVLKSVDFELHVQEPYFSQLKDGLKTVEGRCAIGDYNRIFPGALILLNKSLVLQVQAVSRYASFSNMLEAESLERVLPGVKTIEQGVKVYRNFYSEEKERLNGVIAIRVTMPVSQPYITLSTMLSELSYGGIQRLLGFVHTVGTTVEALLPPRSMLLSSFSLPYNPNV